MTPSMFNVTNRYQYFRYVMQQEQRRARRYQNAMKAGRHYFMKYPRSPAQAMLANRLRKLIKAESSPTSGPEEGCSSATPPAHEK